MPAHRDAQLQGPDYVPTTELCRRLSISRSTVRRHGLTRFAVRVGSAWRFRVADVIAFYKDRP